MLRRRLTSRQREFLGILAVIAMMVVAYHGVALSGKTFDTSAMESGVNGNDPPTGVARPSVNHFRVDPGASAWAMVPWAQVTHQELSQGRVPWWNPYSGAGTPLAANAQSAVFDPLLIAVNLHPTTLSWDLSLLFAFALGGIGTYLFLRSRDISMLGALTGTAAFVMCGFFATGSNNSFARIAVYLPILFLLVDRTVKSEKLRWPAGLGLAIAAAILAGMPEMTFFVLAATVLYAGYRIARSPGPARWRGAGRMAGAGLLGLLFGAPLLVLFLGYLPVSFNVHGPGLGLAAASKATLLNWLIPFVNGYPAALRNTGLIPTRSWIGAGGAVLLVVAAASPAAMRKRGGWLFLGLGLLLLLKIHGFPGLQLVGRLPGVNRTNFISFSPEVVSFCFAVVVAIAIDALRHGEVVRRRLLAGMGMLGVVTLLLLFSNRAILRAGPQISPWRQYLLYAIALGAGGATAAAGLASILRPNLRRLVAPAAAAVVVLELLVMFAPGAYAARTDPYLAPMWLAAVRSGLVTNTQARVFGFDRVLYPNTAGVFGIEDARTLDAVYLTRYVTYIGDFVSPFSDRFTGDFTTPSDVEGNPMFDLLGVRYLLTGPTPTGPTMLDEPASSPSQFRELVTGTVSVFENTTSLPRALVVPAVHRVAGTRDAVAFLKGLGHPMADGTTRLDRFDPSSQAVVEASGGVALPEVSTKAVPARPKRIARIVSYAADEVAIDVPAGAPGLLLLTDTFAPGWEATVNGHLAPVLPTDVAFRGVALTGDAAHVVFRYRPPGATLTWALPLAGLLGLIGGWAALRRRARHGRHGP